MTAHQTPARGESGASMTLCDCGAKPVVYTNPPDKGMSIRCNACWLETKWMNTEAEAIAEWEAGRYTEQEPIGGGVFVNQLGQKP